MPKKPKPKITAWSFSRLGDYENCPLKAKFKHVDRIREPPNKAMDRGRLIHKEAEDYIAGKIKILPQSLECFDEEFARLRAIRTRVQCEIDLAFTKKWAQCGWFDSDAWLRIKIDALYIDDTWDDIQAHCIDYKTGKVNPKHVDQLDLYALGILIAYPEVDIVESSLWYLDQGVEETTRFSRKELPAMKKKWLSRSKPMLADRTFKATPNPLCKWCYFSKSKHGDCEY